jgi:hypothetical protein
MQNNKILNWLIKIQLINKDIRLKRLKRLKRIKKDQIESRKIDSHRKTIMSPTT